MAIHLNFDIIELRAEAEAAYVEQLGTKEKFWLSLDGESHLFKVGRPGTGENWAEKVACEIAKAWGVPTANYELAIIENDQRMGVLTKSFAVGAKGEQGNLVLGNELMARFLRDYAENKRFYRQQNHSIKYIFGILTALKMAPPRGFRRRQGISDASDVFVGYIALDALLGNTDRHHENWGLVSVPGGGDWLAPTFDHASSLGRELKDDARAHKLLTTDKNGNVAAYAHRARSAFYLDSEKTRPLLTIDAFEVAKGLRPDAAKYWLSKLEKLSLDKIRVIIDSVPTNWMSDLAKEFAWCSVKCNREKLLGTQKNE